MLTVRIVYLLNKIFLYYSFHDCQETLSTGSIIHQKHLLSNPQDLNNSPNPVSSIWKQARLIFRKRKKHHSIRYYFRKHHEIFTTSLAKSFTKPFNMFCQCSSYPISTFITTTSRASVTNVSPCFDVIDIQMEVGFIFMSFIAGDNP